VDLPGGYTRGDHSDVRYYRSTATECFETPLERGFVDGHAFGILQVGGSVDHALGHGPTQRPEA